MAVDRSYIGKTGEPITTHIERGKIREFARAIKDDDPLYFDDAYAAREAGAIMPPITFLQTTHWDDGRGRPRPPIGLKRALHGEQEFEFFKPIVVGDVLTAVSRVADIYEKAGRRGGTMTFVVTETEFKSSASSSRAGSCPTASRGFGAPTAPSSASCPFPASGAASARAVEGGAWRSVPPISSTRCCRGCRYASGSLYFPRPQHRLGE